MGLAGARRAIDILDEERRRLSAMKSSDFCSTEVDDTLRPLIEAVVALPIAAKSHRDIDARDSTVRNALDLIAFWRDARGSAARARKLGCCGR